MAANIENEIKRVVRVGDGARSLSELGASVEHALLSDPPEGKGVGTFIHQSVLLVVDGGQEGAVNSLALPVCAEATLLARQSHQQRLQVLAVEYIEHPQGVQTLM